MKVKITLVKLIILTVEHQILCYDQLMILKCSSRSRSSQGQGHIKVKVIQHQCYLRSRPLKVKVIQFQGNSRSPKVKGTSWSSQGYSPFEVKVNLELNGNVFQFYPEVGSWLLSECLF